MESVLGYRFPTLGCCCCGVVRFAGAQFLLPPKVDALLFDVRTVTPGLVFTSILWTRCSGKPSSFRLNGVGDVCFRARWFVVRVYLRFSRAWWLVNWVSDGGVAVAIPRSL
jgi:hypothetical protein